MTVKTKHLLEEINLSQTIEMTGVTEFSHINLNEIDPTFQAIDEGFYTLQVNKLTAKVVTPKAGKNANRRVFEVLPSAPAPADPEGRDRPARADRRHRSRTVRAAASVRRTCERTEEGRTRSAHTVR